MLGTMIRHSLLALVGVATLAGPAFSADFKSALMKPDTIMVGTTGSAPPTSMINSAGELDGYDMAVMKKIAADLGVKVEFVQLDWAGLLPGLIAHRFDVVASGVSRTAKRLKSTDFIMLSPYIVNGVAVTKLASNDAIKSWDDACGKTVGVVRGSTEIDGIKASVPANCITKVTEYPGWTELSLDLKNGRIDWIGMDYLGPAYLAKNDPTITVLPDVHAPNTQSIAVSSKEPDLAKAMDDLLAKYRTDGTLDTLVKQYFGQGVDFSHLPPDPAS